MSMLSEKYLAGFLDSDGSIQVLWRAVDRADTDPTMRRAYLSLEWSQRSDRDDVLRLIQRDYGGKLSVSHGKYTCLKIFGKPAVMLLYRIKGHLVVKRSYADAVLSLLGEPRKLETALAYLKIQRRVKSLPLPNYPSRKWLAGYFDGDGCFSCRIDRGRTSASLYLEAAASDFDCESLELLQKAFGGTITTMDSGRAHIKKWWLHIPPSKAIKFLGHCGQWMIVKKAQADFILGCAQMGHFRDGSIIKNALKQLKAQPHRLSEQNVVRGLLKTVRDIPDTEILEKKRRVMAHARSLKRVA